MLLQYAREHHFPNPTFFVDDGVSGVTYDRPGFQAMLAEIEAGRVAVAIAKDLSRLGRNSALTGLSIRRQRQMCIRDRPSRKPRVSEAYP